jgi:two-component system, chemotaxis family, protein-glutamate methylesterase/glutaminase
MIGASASRYELVVIGTSLGGLTALPVILRGLPPDFRMPVVIVQHRTIGADAGALAAVLQRSCALQVREAHDKDPLATGRVYLAPADYHLLVDDGHLALSTEGRVQYARPSIDVLFQSAAETYGGRVVGVVLTGANRDGVEGARRIKERGGFIVVQDPSTAESRVMPAAVLAAVTADRVVPLAEVPPLLAMCSVARLRS